MDETSKTKALWGSFELSILKGEGIDIGCGPDPVNPEVRRFDFEDGDANEITKFVPQQFDYVYSSHCLEHMHNPWKALQEWWKLVKPGGHLFFIVPDEDLYEQGVFPSRFNPDHKATFTISKAQSWSPVSTNILDLVRSLPSSELISVSLQDHGYNMRLIKHGAFKTRGPILNYILKKSKGLQKHGYTFAKHIEKWIYCWRVVDQTATGALAQIQCIVKKNELSS